MTDEWDYPQNSSTLSNVMTSFNKSAHDSFGPVAVGVLVNHNVHVFISGCLTLKFFGSWNTVKGSCEAMAAGDEDSLLRESLSNASVGGAGERTSVIMKILRYDANGYEIEEQRYTDGVRERTGKRECENFGDGFESRKKEEQSRIDSLVTIRIV